MSDETPRRSVLDKHQLSPQAGSKVLPETEEQRAYSIVRDRGGRLLMLELRFKNGDCAAFGYAYFAGMQFYSSGVLELYFAGNKVTVTGRNLKPIYDGLLEHAVGCLREEAAAAGAQPEAETFISEIKLAAS